MYDFYFVKLLISRLTRYFETVYERDEINYVWSIKNPNGSLNKFQYKIFKASKLSTYDFPTLYTTLLHHLIKINLLI